MASNPPNVKGPLISEDERVRREKAVRAANASVMLEGFVIPAEAHALDRIFIEGGMSNAEHTAALLRLAAA